MNPPSLAIKAMRSTQSKTSAFTLIELILVLLILAIIAALVAPSLTKFAEGRGTNNAATRIVSLTNYARTQAQSEGRIYRLNFDPANHDFWLTAQDDNGVFQSPGNDFGQHFDAGQDVQMDVQVTPQVMADLNLPADEQQQATQAVSSVTQPQAQANALLQNTHPDGTQFVEFFPSGRTDPANIRLNGPHDSRVEITCASATESFRILRPEEMTQ